MPRRTRTRKSATKADSGPTPSASGAGPEFTRFRELTRRLVRVPKKEITEAEKRAKKTR